MKNWTVGLQVRIDEAEKEGSIKQFLSEELRELPNYKKLCDCGDQVKYNETLGDSLAMRLICLRCGGLIFGEVETT